jgi:hypothetical protein
MKFYEGVGPLMVQLNRVAHVGGLFPWIGIYYFRPFRNLAKAESNH